MRVKMLVSETQRLVEGANQMHLRAGHEYDIPAWLAQSWAARTPPVCEVLTGDVDLPVGYSVEGGQGGYYSVTDASGEVVPGPSNGKWQGRDGAAQGAWSYFNAEGQE